MVLIYINKFINFIIGPYLSGVECNASAIWFDEGTFNVMVKAIDIYCAESEWPDALEVTIPKTKIYNLLIKLFYNILEHFPFLNKILNQIISTKNSKIFFFIF